MLLSLFRRNAMRGTDTLRLPPAVVHRRLHDLPLLVSHPPNIPYLLAMHAPDTPLACCSLSGLRATDPRLSSPPARYLLGRSERSSRLRHCEVRGTKRT
eukprot:419159-Rhodomonas_salina.1